MPSFGGYFTLEELILQLQQLIGTKLGTDNPKFTPDLCTDAIMMAARQWMPLLPTSFQTNRTETEQAIIIGSGNYFSNPIPAEVARVLTAEITLPLPGAVGYQLELYGFSAHPERDSNDFIGRKAELSVEKANRYNIRLLRLVGSVIHIYPAAASSTTLTLMVRRYIDTPASLSEEVDIPAKAVPFILAAAATTGKFADMRESAGLAFARDMRDLLGRIIQLEDRKIASPQG